MRVFSEQARVRELRDTGLPYDVTREQSRMASIGACEGPFRGWRRHLALQTPVTIEIGGGQVYVIGRAGK